jgi:hypothetical protein
MAQYSFVTHWRFDAPIEDVFEAIRHYQAWPSWWPSIKAAKQVRPGDAEGIGETVEFTFRTKLPYTLSFLMTTERVQAPTELDGRASGELAGTGRWRLARDGEGTKVTYYWDVSTTRWWMNLLTPLARPAFKWNHDQVMEDGRRGLIRLLAREAAGRSQATAGAA